MGTVRLAYNSSAIVVMSQGVSMVDALLPLEDTLNMMNKFMCSLFCNMVKMDALLSCSVVIHLDKVNECHKTLFTPNTNTHCKHVLYTLHVCIE